MARPEGGSPYTIDHQARPDEWLRAVYSDASIITRGGSRQVSPATNDSG
jgi:protein-L-isoaspartate(D-aspartate) O-methyltransferase